MSVIKDLLPPQDIDALLGDVAEERARRSTLWYWSQLLAIVFVASWRDARAHSLIALRATATGLMTLTVAFYVALAIGRVLWVLSHGGYYIGSYWLTLPHFTDRWPYDPLAVIGSNALAFFLSGWAIVRFHRVHGIAMAMPFLAVMTLFASALLVILAMDTGTGTRPMPLGQFIAIFGTLFASVPGGILLGGIVGLRSGRSVRS